MNKLIEFTKNWKYRNLLHIVGGFILGFVLKLFLPWYISILIVFTFANYWEYTQVILYKAKYSIYDIILTTLGSVLGSVLVIFLVHQLK